MLLVGEHGGGEGRGTGQQSDSRNVAQDNFSDV
jgi:hypothetical protein